jgi:hypothetical protein
MASHDKDASPWVCGEHLRAGGRRQAYWHNAQTGETVWERPEGAAEPPKGAEVVAPIYYNGLIPQFHLKYYNLHVQ